MKKMLLVMAATALVGANTVQAQSETVTSVNVVGYYSVTIPANGIALVTPVLESFNSGTLQDLVGAQLPVGSFAWIWNRESKNYIATSRTLFGGWGATNVILRGDTVWLKPPTGSGSHTVTFMGEVPGDYNEAGTTTLYNISGTDAVGYTYPIDVVWTNTTLSAQLAVGSQIVVWNTATQAYETYGKTLFSGWGVPAGYTIPAGRGFWVRSATPVDWTETAPYDL